MAGERRERRSHFRGKPRPGRRVEVSFSGADGAPRRAHTRNIGVGGAFVVTTTPEPPGTRLTLSVLVPTASEPLRVRGEVRWITAGGAATGEPPGMGLRFDPLDVEARLQLTEYFASLTGREEAAG
jgi:uncharacterized protein (TIGR02266 family)